jgi:hypothetical protein
MSLDRAVVADLEGIVGAARVRTEPGLYVCVLGGIASGVAAHRRL